MMTKRGAAVTAALLCFCVRPIVSWGFSGHEITGEIALRLLKPTVSEAVRDILPPYNNGSLSQIAPWADRIKRQKAYQFSAVLHYVNPKEDFPPKTCHYEDGEVDCPDDSCVVGAIRNYTHRLQSPRNAKDREEALKFLVHFIGDIHQPLHVTGRHRGGNGDKAMWDGHRSNLHYVWDTGMIVKRIREDFRGNQDDYVDFILGELASKWSQRSALWVKCGSSASGQEESVVCPDKWAGEIDRLNCHDTYPGYSEVEDLSGYYYRDMRAMDYPDVLLAQSGVRLAHVLNNVLAAGVPKIDSGSKNAWQHVWTLVDILRHIILG